MIRELGSNVVFRAALLIVAIVFGSIIMESESRPMTREEDESLQTKSVLELVSRYEMVQDAGYGEEKLSTVLIDGTLLCYSLHPQPISGALVEVVCTKNNEKENTSVKGVTNEYGEFIIDLPSQLHAISKLDKACSVEVLQVPKHSPCYQSAYAIKQGQLTLSSQGNGIRTYTAGIIEIASPTIQKLS